MVNGATSKTQKLISRGSENPKVARAAREVSDILMRMALGQAQYFAECVERAFPNLTEEESENLAFFFSRASDYFAQKAMGDRFPHAGYNDKTIRRWSTDEEYFYNIHKVFCVLACDLEYCSQNMDCWETRSAFCRMDEKVPSSGSESL